jgi:hypothetical protein
MRIRDNKIGKPEGLHKLNMKPEVCPMLNYGSRKYLPS